MISSSGCAALPVVSLSIDDLQLSPQSGCLQDDVRLPPGLAHRMGVASGMPALPTPRSGWLNLSVIAFKTIGVEGSDRQK
jgi:hypothetical protein